MAKSGLPDNDFDEIGLSLAGDALLIVHGIVVEALGAPGNGDVLDKLSDLALRLRNEERSTEESPDVAVDWPRGGFAEGTGDMGFHVAAGGSEYDGITLYWEAGADGLPALSYSYDGRDELYESEPFEG